MKKNFKIIIILSIVVIIAIAGGIFAYLYLKTDIFRSKQELFSKYITQTVVQFQKTLDLQTVKEYEKLQNESKYESNTDIKIVNSEGGEISNPFNKLNAKISMQKDDANEYLYGDAQILYEEEKYLEAEIIKEQGVFGVRLPDVVKQFVTVKDDEKLEEVANSIGVKATDLKEVIHFFDANNTIMSNINVDKYKTKYLNILVQELQKGTFAKQKDAMITYNNNTTKTNAYEVLFTSEQVKNMIIACLNNLKSETELLEKISILTEENISKLIEQLQVSNEISTLKITVFEQGQKTIRTIVEIGTFKVVIDNVNDKDAIKNIIQLTDLKSEDDLEYIIEIIKDNKDGQENFKIKIDSIKNGESNTISFIMQASMSKTETNLKSEISYEQGIKLISLEINNIVKLGNDFERKQIVGTNENMLLNDLDEEKRVYVINFLSKKIPEKINEKVKLLMENLEVKGNNKEETILGDVQSENVEDKTAKIETNKFNAKFEFYTGENVSATNVKQLLEIVGSNLEGYENVQSEADGKNIIKLKIKENAINKDKANEVVGMIKDNNKYKVSISYSDTNGLIEYITITEI